MNFEINNKYKEFTSFKKGTVQNDSIFFNKIEVLITSNVSQLESQQGIFIYDRQNFSFELLTGEKLYIRTYKDFDTCRIIEMNINSSITTNPILSATAIDKVNQIQKEFDTMKEVYPIGFTASKNEELPNTTLQLKRLKENFN